MVNNTKMKTKTTTDYTKNKDPGSTDGCLTGNDMREKLHDEPDQELGEPENEDKAESLGSSSEEYPSDGELDEELTLQSVKNLMWSLRQEPVQFYTEPFHRKLASLLIMVQSGAAPLSTIVLEARMADAVLCALTLLAIHRGSSCD